MQGVDVAGADSTSADEEAGLGKVSGKATCPSPRDEVAYNHAGARFSLVRLPFRQIYVRKMTQSIAHLGVAFFERRPADPENPFKNGFRFLKCSLCCPCAGEVR